MRNLDQRFPLHLWAVMAVIATSLLIASPAGAQTGNLNRPYEPVILTGKEFPEFSNNAAAMAQLFLYKYSGTTWTQIPFQFDEVEPDSATPANPTYFRPGDGKLDDQDELAFMVRDAGDKAPTNAWVNDASARTFQRYEIELTDPVNSNKGYVYLFRSTTLSVGPAVKDYVTYVAPSASPGKDVVRGQSYEEGHLDNGLNNSLFVPVSENGSGTNFLDRLKLRFQINIGLPLTFNEENFNLLPPIRIRDGRTRLIRELRERISLFGTDIDFPILIRYYGYSTVLGTALNLTSLPAAVRVTLLRQSVDFAANVNGAKWYNQNVTNAITVTGATGNLNATQGAIVTEPNLNWYMMSSAHGSYINIFSLPANLGTTRSFYFHDAASGSNDKTDDTGDGKSYGDSGFLASATTEITKAAYNLLVTSYILGKDQPRTVAETLHNQASKPLTWKTQSQRNTVAVRENTNFVPQQFALLQNSPNPISLATPSTTIRYELPFMSHVPVSLRIFNLLGQNVRELVNAAQPAGRYEVQWDGRLADGEFAPAGIYFYQLQAGNQVATQKLMLLTR